MKRLILQKWSLLATTIFCAVSIAAASVIQFSHWKYCFSFALIGGSITTALYLFTRKKLILTEIIIDNTIIHIQPAVISGTTDDDKAETEKLREKFGVRISTFGILLGNKIINWGVGNENRLKAAEIGKDYISIDYGTVIEMQNIRLLYSRPDGDELADIVKKFQHETGIVPVIAA